MSSAGKHSFKVVLLGEGTERVERGGGWRGGGGTASAGWEGGKTKNKNIGRAGNP